MMDVDLGLPGPRAATRVVVAMSGGVDSSVVAALVKHAGYDVVGVTLQLYDNGAATHRAGACCAGQDIHDARQRRREARHSPLRARLRGALPRGGDRAFRRRAMRGARRRSPASPATRPSSSPISWRPRASSTPPRWRPAITSGRAWSTAAARSSGRVDLDRDQSYFLFATTREQLDFLRFPLGDLTKDETRAIARELGLAVADKRDSQDICFVPQGRYTDIVEKLKPGSGAAGRHRACRRARARPARGRDPLHGRPAARARHRCRRAALRGAARCGERARRRRSARGARRALDRAARFQLAGRGRSAGGGRRRAARSSRASAPTRPPAAATLELREAGRWSSSRRTRWASLPVRPACSTTATARTPACSAAARSPRNMEQGGEGGLTVAALRTAGSAAAVPRNARRDFPASGRPWRGASRPSRCPDAAAARRCPS